MGNVRPGAPHFRHLDRTSGFPQISSVNLLHLKTRIARLNFSEAAKRAAALKAEFHSEDEELYRQGKQVMCCARIRRRWGSIAAGGAA
jgi:hypothetical protein